MSAKPVYRAQRCRSASRRRVPHKRNAPATQCIVHRCGRRQRSPPAAAIADLDNKDIGTVIVGGCAHDSPLARGIEVAELGGVRERFVNGQNHVTASLLPNGKCCCSQLANSIRTCAAPEASAPVVQTSSDRLSLHASPSTGCRQRSSIRRTRPTLELRAAEIVKCVIESPVQRDLDAEKAMGRGGRPLGHHPEARFGSPRRVQRLVRGDQVFMLGREIAALRGMSD